MRYTLRTLLFVATVSFAYAPQPHSDGHSFLSGHSRSQHLPGEKLTGWFSTFDEEIKTKFMKSLRLSAFTSNHYDLVEEVKRKLQGSTAEKQDIIVKASTYEIENLFNEVGEEISRLDATNGDHRVVGSMGAIFGLRHLVETDVQTTSQSDGSVDIKVRYSIDEFEVRYPRYNTKISGLYTPEGVLSLFYYDGNDVEITLNVPHFDSLPVDGSCIVHIKDYEVTKLGPLKVVIHAETSTLRVPAFQSRIHSIMEGNEKMMKIKIANHVIYKAYRLLKPDSFVCKDESLLSWLREKNPGIEF